MHQNKGAQPAEKRIRRAAAACYHCHWRKVRCDAALLKYPCTNCTLDGRTDCTLRPNATTRFKNLQKNDDEKSPPESTAPDVCQRMAPSESTSEVAMLLQNSGCPELQAQMECDLGFDLGVSTQVPGPYDIDSAHLMVGNTGTVFPGQHFLNLDGLSSLPMSDVHVLAINGCLEIPPKPAVDVFLRKYFLLLHPSIPILDEVQFWNTFLQSNENPGYSRKVSLFVFQAMLLASCTVCILQPYFVFRS